MGLEFIKAEVQDYEREHPYPVSRSDQYHWWINCIAKIKERLFSDVWNVEFEGLDKKLDPNAAKIVGDFWAEMKKLKEKHLG